MRDLIKEGVRDRVDDRSSMEKILEKPTPLYRSPRCKTSIGGVGIR
jgi:hypothetical protein